MAELIWTEPALADLDAMRVFAHVGQLAAQPESGSRPRELGPRSRYRQIVEPPCRVFYRHDIKAERVFILHVMRGEMRLRKGRLGKRERGGSAA